MRRFVHRVASATWGSQGLRHRRLRLRRRREVAGERLRKSRQQILGFGNPHGRLPGTTDLGPKAVAALLIAVALLPVGWAYPHVARAWVLPAYDYMNERYLGLSLFDAKHRYLGMLSGWKDPLGDFSDSQPTPDHRSAHVSVVPDDWQRIVRFLEDRHFDSLRNFNGIDWPALLKAPLTWLLPMTRSRGASTIPMQVSKVMRHRYSSGVPIAHRVSEKLTQLLHAPVLERFLGPKRVLRWYAQHAPIAIGARGSQMGLTLHGIATAALTLYGKQPHELSLAKQAVLAAAVHRPIKLALPNDPASRADARRRWVKVRRRAAYGLRGTIEPGPKLEAALAELEELPPPEPTVHPDLEHLLPDDPAERFRVLANPFRRADLFAGSAIAPLLAELEESHGRLWRRSIHRVQLTLDASVNVEFERAMETHLRNLEARLRPSLGLQLDGDGSESIPNAHVAIAVSDSSGALKYVYHPQEASVFAGSERVLAADGRITREQSGLPIASIGKMALSVLAAEDGDRPDARYCNRSVRDRTVRNPGGDRGVRSCKELGAWYSAHEVFARSLNLPLIWRALALPDARLRRAAVDMGFHMPDDGVPASSMVLGTIGASPRRVLALAVDIGNALGSHEPAPALPHVIRAADVTGPLPAPFRPARRSVGVDRRLVTPEARSYVREVLGGPLEAGGTLQRIGDWKDRPGVRSHIAKTGTATLRDGSTRALWVVGALDYDGNLYAYVAYVGAPSNRKPIGTNLSAGQLAPVVRGVLESIVRAR